MSTLPAVTIVVPTIAADDHLPTLLDSVAALDYPADLVRTIVVDNRPTTASRAVLDGYAWVTALPQRENLGFASGVNAGVRAAGTPLVAFCNDDMRLDRAWLRELVAAHDPDGGWSCVAGLILDWEGERVDFAGGFVNLHGFAGQRSFGERALDVRVEDGLELPFACGGSMLLARELFLELGGFDPRFFALLEDVDLGWRLRLAGHRIRLAAGARSFHRHGATTQTFLDDDERSFLFERNALLMLLKNVGDENLARVLAYALFLLAARAAEAAPEGTPPGLRAVDEIVGRFADVLDERARVQRLRRRDDADVIAELGEPFLAVSAAESYLEAGPLLARLLALDRLAGGRSSGDATEELRQLLETWRARYGVGRSPLWHLRRSVATLLRRGG